MGKVCWGLEGLGLEHFFHKIRDPCEQHYREGYVQRTEIVVNNITEGELYMYVQGLF